jgi:hypothetical protein
LAAFRDSTPRASRRPITRTAGSLLAGAGVDLAQLRRLLPGVEPYAVSVRPAPRLLRALWGRDVAAMAVRRMVWVRPDLLAADRLPAPLLLHEMVHVQQWRRLGIPRFISRYLGAYLKSRAGGHGHRHAYHSIPLELEADEVARALLQAKPER